MAGKKPRLTKNQAEWEKQYNLLKRRISDWKRKFHAVFNELPIKPQRVTKADIQRLKDITWKKLTPLQKESARKEYTYRYDEKWEDVYKPQPPYIPPTETDFYSNLDYGNEYDEEWEEQHPDWDKEDEDGYKEAVVSEDEIQEWITSTIEAITIDQEIPAVREQLISLVESAIRQSGYNRSYFEYLEEKADEFNNLAMKAMHGYIRRNGKVIYIEKDGETAFAAFATLLNLGRPLEQSQSEDLTMYGDMIFDFADFE